MKKLHALVLGATGQELVKLLLKDSNRKPQQRKLNTK